MNLRKITLATLLAGLCLLGEGCADTATAQGNKTQDNKIPDYKNAKLPIDVRVADLLKRMTVEEKVGQLRSLFAAYPKINAALLQDPHQMDSLFGNGISMINPDFENSLEESINNRNAVQVYLRDHTRLGIPTIFLDEAHHGLLAMKADVFPTCIGLACSWDTLLVQKIYTYVSAQASARGTNMVLAPVIDVCRDPRWGRQMCIRDRYLHQLQNFLFAIAGYELDPMLEN